MMDGWDWLWMTFGMGFWLVLIGVVVYIAVRLATRRPRAGRP
jgi:flagellar biogenesis protein FliO